MQITASHKFSKLLILNINISDFWSNTSKNDVFGIDLIKVYVTIWFVSFVIFDSRWAAALINCCLRIPVRNAQLAKMLVNACAIAPPLFQNCSCFVSIGGLNIFNILFLILHGFGKLLLNLLTQLICCNFKSCVISIESLLELHFLLDGKLFPSDETIVLTWALLKSKLGWFTSWMHFTHTLSKSVNITRITWWKIVNISFEVFDNRFQNGFLMSCDVNLGTNPSLIQRHGDIIILLGVEQSICPSTSLLTFTLNFLVINSNF